MILFSENCGQTRHCTRNTAGHIIHGHDVLNLTLPWSLSVIQLHVHFYLTFKQQLNSTQEPLQQPKVTPVGYNPRSVSTRILCFRIVNLYIMLNFKS